MGRNKGRFLKKMYIVSLTGLPPTIRLKEFRKLFKDAPNIPYYIRHIPFGKNQITSLDRVLIELYSKSDADILVTLVNNQIYISQFNIYYLCKARIESTSEISNTENPALKNIFQPNKNKSENHDKVLPKSDTDSKDKLIPKFKKSKRILMDEMESLVTKHCQRNKILFLTTFNAQIRMRLTELFEGRKLEELPTSDVVKMYREVYDKSTDESFVIETYELVQLACWPTEDTLKDGIYLEELELEDEGKMTRNTLQKFIFT